MHVTLNTINDVDFRGYFLFISFIFMHMEGLALVNVDGNTLNVACCVDEGGSVDTQSLSTVVS